ncbi:MAG TPA: TetR family transcriptional regulator [Iamia sp.]
MTDATDEVVGRAGDRRAELLDGATAWAAENGIATLSLRPLAAALGTSDRMLVYYFGSRDRLVEAIAGHAAEGIAAVMASIGPAGTSRSARTWLDQCWELFGDPAARPALAVLFELDALGLRQPGAPRAAAAGVAARWSAVVDDALAALGVPARRRSGGLTAVVAGAIVGIALEALLADEPVRPAGAITTLARLIDAERSS